MKSILVGVDLSPESEHAVAHAIAIARRAGSRVVLGMADCVPGLPANLTENTEEVALGYTQELERRLAADRVQLGALRERWSGQGPELSQVIVDGFADDELPKVAAELHADLIVVGSRGRTGLRRWALGSVAERVVRRAEQSVLVARGDAPANGYQRVVIGADFTTLSALAVERALPLFAPEVHIDLVYGWEWPWTGALTPVSDAPPRFDLRAELEAPLGKIGERLSASVRALGRPAPTIRVHVSAGGAANGLVAVATDQHADLVVVGSHGHRGIRRFMLGSVAEATVRHAPCSVLVGR